MRARSGSGSRLCLSLAGWPSLARSLLCSKAMAGAATTFVVDVEDRCRKMGGACTHNMFSSSPSQESLNQFEAPYVNVKTGRMSTTTFFRGEPVLSQPEHKSGRSFFFV